MGCVVRLWTAPLLHATPRTWLRSLSTSVYRAPILVCHAAMFLFQDKRTGMSSIKLYMDGGTPKGDGVLTYEDPNAAHKSVGAFTGTVQHFATLVMVDELPRLHF